MQEEQRRSQQSHERRLPAVSSLSASPSSLSLFAYTFTFSLSVHEAMQWCSCSFLLNEQHLHKDTQLQCIHQQTTMPHKKLHCATFLQVPCCPVSHESSLQTDSGSQAKMAQQVSLYIFVTLPILSLGRACTYKYTYKASGIVCCRPMLHCNSTKTSFQMTCRH